MQQYRGVVVRFDSGRGVGVIRSRRHPQDLPVSSQNIIGGEALRAGQRVKFSVQSGVEKTWAVQVIPGRPGLPPGISTVFVPLLLLAAASAGTYYASDLSRIASWLAAVNVLSALYWTIDGLTARTGRRRLPPGILLGLAALGGSPSALLVSIIFRKVWRSRAFSTAFVVIVVAQAVGLGYYVSQRGLPPMTRSASADPDETQ